MPRSARPDAARGSGRDLRSLAGLTGAVEQPGLQLGRRAARNAAMRAKIDPIRQSRMAGSELRQGFVAAACKTSLFPDLIEAARITTIALQDVLAPDPKPAGDPNIDRVLFREWVSLCGPRALGYALGRT